jgi:hypothetical protein
MSHLRVSRVTGVVLVVFGFAPGMCAGTIAAWTDAGNQ